MPDETREPLTRARVVEAAIVLADTGGLAAISMRKVAAELGFEVMSLYNHVANKQDLLAGMLEHVIGEIEMPDLDAGWRSALRTNAVSIKAMFERHRWAIGLWVSSIPGVRRFDLMEWQLRVLAESGLDERRAHDAFHAIGNHVSGYMLANQAMSMDDSDQDAMLDHVMSIIDDERHAHVIRHIHQHLEGDSGPSFEYVLDLLIAGIAG
jgi:AcrR family transcriptional regulator